MYNICLLGMSSWFEWEKGVVNRNRYIFQALKKHPEVDRILLVDYLPFSFRRKIREYFKAKIYKRDRNTVLKGWTYKVNKADDKVWVYSGWGKNIEKVVGEILPPENRLYLSYNPMDISFLDLPDGIKIFDAVDNWAEHPAYINYKNRLLVNYKEIEKKADVVFTVSDELKNLFKENTNVFWVPNGVDVANYQRNDIQVGDYELSGMKKPVIGYVGVIQERLDLKLVRFLAGKFPNYSFVFIGPVWKGIEQEFNTVLNSHKNVYSLGFKPAEITPKYIKDFDAAIVPHKINELTASMNPMKIYEYLACGKPVVTTSVAGVEAFGDLIYVADRFDDFADKLEKAVALGDSRKEEYLKFVQEHTWEKRAEEMLKQIKKLKCKSQNLN